MQENTLVLTPSAGGLAGAAWSSQPVVAWTPWQTSFRVSMHDGSSNAADGLAFVLTQSQETLGMGGGYLGYTPLAPSVAVEFDTYRNEWDPNANHIAVNVNGDVDKPVGVAAPAFKMSGSTFSAWIDYDPASQKLSVYVDPGHSKPATPVLTTVVDLLSVLPGAAFAGFTAGTGSRWQRHDVLSWRLEATAAPQPKPGKYVALGDSYSSGFGLDPTYPGTRGDEDKGENNCWRAYDAYSGIVAGRVGLDLDFHACQGAVTHDFYHSRGKRDAKYATWGEIPQLSHLSGDESLVTFSIGGNDSGFGDIYSECVLGAELLPWNTCSGDDKVTKPLAASFARIDGGSAGTDARLQRITPYPELFRDVRQGAPRAARVVLGYPKFFPAGGADTRFRCQGIKRVDQAWMHDKTNELNAIIKRQAALNGFRYADAGDRFVGHEFCGASGDEWFYGVLDDGAVHPTKPGHAAMADAVLDALNNDARPRFLVRPLQTITTSFDVDGPLDTLGVGIEWPGSDIQLSLTSPSGVVYNRTARPGGATGSHGPTWDQLTVPRPEVGTWQVSMFGADVAAAGEEARLTVARVEPANQSPVAGLTWNVDGTRLSLDATGSADPDGSIGSYTWYLDLAGEERVLTGAKATTTVPAGQPFTVTLRVQDNRGAASYLSRNVAPIDVKPGSVDNPINLKSRGVVPIAILSSAAFDATAIDPSTLKVGPAGATVAHGGHIEDANGDGRADLVVQVATQDLGLRSTDTALGLTGKLRDGTQFAGSDRVRVMK